MQNGKDLSHLVGAEAPQSLWTEDFAGAMVGFGAYQHGQPMMSILVPMGPGLCRTITLPIDPVSMRLALAQLFGGAEAEMPSSPSEMGVEP